MKLFSLCFVFSLIVIFLVCSHSINGQELKIREKRNGESCVTFDEDTHYCCHEDEKDGEVVCCDDDLKEKPDCSDGEYGFFANECHCQMYFNCYNYTRNEFPCPYGGYWTSDTSEWACLEITKRVRGMNKICKPRDYKLTRKTQKFIRVTFTIRDSAQDPPVDTVTFTDTFLKAPLYNIMLYFAGKRDDFSFESTFHDVYWRFISCVNGLCGDFANNQTWWRITNGGVKIPVGASSYMVGNDADIVFDFVKSPGHD